MTLPEINQGTDTANIVERNINANVTPIRGPRTEKLEVVLASDIDHINSSAMVRHSRMARMMEWISSRSDLSSRTDLGWTCRRFPFNTA